MVFGKHWKLGQKQHDLDHGIGGGAGGAGAEAKSSKMASFTSSPLFSTDLKLGSRLCNSSTSLVRISLQNETSKKANLRLNSAKWIIPANDISRQNEMFRKKRRGTFAEKAAS